jgi:hypothetical protein
MGMPFSDKARLAAKKKADEAAAAATA